MAPVSPMSEPAAFGCSPHRGRGSVVAGLTVEQAPGSGRGGRRAGRSPRACAAGSSAGRPPRPSAAPCCPGRIQGVRRDRGVRAGALVVVLLEQRLPTGCPRRGTRGPRRRRPTDRSPGRCPAGRAGTSRNHKLLAPAQVRHDARDGHRGGSRHHHAMRVLVRQPLALQPHDAALQVEPAEQLGALVGGAVGSGPRGGLTDPPWHRNRSAATAPGPSGRLWRMSERDPSGTGIRVLTTGRPDRRRDRPAPGRRPRRGCRVRLSRPLPWGHPRTVAVVFHRRSDHGVAGVGRPRHGIRSGGPARRPGRARPGHRWRQLGRLDVPRGLMPVVARAARPGHPRGRVGLDVDPRRSPGGDRRGTRRGARPGRGRGRGPTFAPPTQPAHPRAALRAAGPTLGRRARPTHGCAGRRGRQRTVCRRARPPSPASRSRPGPPGSGLGRRRHRPPHPAGRSPRSARARWGCSPTTTSPAGSPPGWGTRPGWSGPHAGSGREVSLVWNRPPTVKGQRCPRSATVPSTSTSRTAVVTDAPSS